MGFRRRVMVDGLNLERFLQRAGENGIVLSAVKRTTPRHLEAVVDDGAITQLSELAEKGGWRFAQGRHTGAGRIFDRLMGRRWLLGAAAVLVVLCMAAQGMLWQIRIIDAGTYEADVRMALAEMGITLPKPRSTVDAGAVRDALEWRYPEVAWVEVGFRGVTLEIRMVEGVAGGDAPPSDGACDVVAARDGVVQRLVTRAGTPVVEPGDIVTAGQVLIKGEERTSAGGVRPVAARGSVFARVWDSAAVTTPMTTVETVYTGRVQTTRSVLSPWFPLWPQGQTEYAHEDVSVREMPLGGFIWPLTYGVQTHHEADFRSVKTDYQSVIDENNRAATMKLNALAGRSDSLVDNWVNWSIIEDEILLSVATGERLVDIAQQERSSGMAATE